MIKTRARNIQDIFDQGTYIDLRSAVGKAIIKAMLDSGVSSVATRWVYQSKHVRWFMDDSRPATGKDAYKGFKRYVSKNFNHVQDNIRQY